MTRSWRLRLPARTRGTPPSRTRTPLCDSIRSATGGPMRPSTRRCPSRPVAGQLTGVNPADPARSQFSYAGFGAAPRYLAADGFNRLLIASTSGLMVFNTSNRTIIRGAPGIPLSNATALAADGLGRIYVTEAGGCASGGATGRVRIFGNDLVERVGVSAGVCPVAAVVTEIPAEQYRLGGGCVGGGAPLTPAPLPRPPPR